MTNLNINPELKKELLEELDYVLMQTTSLAHRNPRSPKALRKLIQCTTTQAKNVLGEWFEANRGDRVDSKKYANQLIEKYPFKNLNEVPFIDLEW
jgi:hypothetical protein